MTTVLLFGHFKEVIISSRFHNKWHRVNHHTYVTPGYPDSSHDPIASPYQPFSGDFVLAGALSAVAPLSAYAGYFYTRSNGGTTLIVKAEGTNSTGLFASGTDVGIVTRSLSGDLGSIDIAGGSTVVTWPHFDVGYLALSAKGNALITDALSAGSIWTNILYSTSAVILVTDMHITELSGFVVKGSDWRLTVPTTIDPTTQQLVWLKGIGLSGTSWASFAGDIEGRDLYGRHIQVSGITLTDSVSTVIFEPTSTIVSVATSSNEFLVVNINGSPRAIRLWDV